MKKRLIGLLILLAPAAFGQSVAYFTATMTATSQTSTPLVFPGYSSFSVGNITLTGTALTTATFAVKGSADQSCASYTSLPINAVATPQTTALTMTATTAGTYQVNVAGFRCIEFVTSGTFTATNIQLSLAVSGSGFIARNPAGTSGVASFASRTGAVTPASNDYAFSQISGLLDLSQLPAGGYSSGTIVVSSGLAAGSAYYAGAGGLAAAKANSTSTMPAACIAISSTACMANGLYTTTGLTAGAPYYVSDASAGALTATVPSTSGDTVQQVGVALSSTQMLIAPNPNPTSVP